MAVPSATVIQYYTGVLRLQPTAAQVSYYSNAADAATLLNVLEGVATLEINPIIRLYQGAFNRVPDSAGLTFIAGQYVGGPVGTAANWTLQQISQNFTASPEFQATYGVNPLGTTQGTTGYISALYNNILNRVPSTSEVAFWQSWATEQLKTQPAATVTATLLTMFTESPEFIRTSAPYIQAFQSASAQGTETYTGTLWAQGTGEVYTLTTSIDAPGTGAFAAGSPHGNSTIYGSFNNGTSTTFNPGDNIQATGGNNTLSLSDGGTAGTGNVAAVAATVQGVQNLVVNSGEAVTINTGATSAALWTALAQITATTNSLSSNKDTITAAATTNVTVTDTASGSTGAAGVTVNGGNNVVVTEKGTTTGGAAAAITVGGTTATNPAGTITVNVTGTGNSTVAADGGTGTTVATSQSGAVTVGANQASTGAVAITVTNGATGGGTIAATGGTSITVTDTAATTGSGQVGIANAITATGNSATGAITVNQTGVSGGLITVNGGSNVVINTTGNLNTSTVAVGGTTAPTGTVTIVDTNTKYNSADVITVADNSAKNTTGAISITTTATSGAIKVGTGATNQGVTGNVTIVDQTTAGGKTFYGTGTINVNVNGATNVAVTGGAAGGGSTVRDWATNNALNTVSLTGFQGAITATSSALTTVNINNSLVLNPLNAAVSATALTVSNSTAAHALTVNLNNTKANTAVTDAAAQTINIVDAGTTNDSLAFVAGYAGKHFYNITNNGTGSFTLTALTDTGVATGSTVTLAGSGAINVGSLFTGNTGGGALYYTSINAANATGAITATVDATTTNGGQSFTGGSGNDVVTVNANGGITSVINGGLGNDTLVLTSVATNYTTALGGSLTGFENLRLSGANITGSYAADGFTAGLSVTGLTQTAVTAATAGNSATFTNVAANESLTVLAQADTSSWSGKFTYNAGDTVTLTINGVTKSTTAATDAQTTLNALRTAFGTVNGVTIASATADVGGVSTITVTGATTASIADTTAGKAAQVAVTNAISGVVSESLATAAQAATGNTLPLTLNSTTGSAAVNTVVNFANNQTLSLTSSQYNGGVAANVVNLTDSTATAQANNATTLNISGANALTATYTQIGTATNALTTINASGSSGAVDVSNVQGKTTGLTITGGSGALTAVGSGAAAGQTASNYYTANDTINGGTGGSTITVGFAGAGGAAGTTTINLANATSKRDTIKTSVDTTVGARATVNNFVVNAASTADLLQFAASKTVVSTNATPVSTAAAGGTDTYTISNGVVTFTGADSLTQKLTSATAIVNAANANNGNATTNNVVAFVYNGNTYVVASGGTADAAHADILTLNGVTGITQLGGKTAAAGSILGAAASTTGEIVGAAATAISSHAAATTANDAGYSIQAISGTDTGALTLTNLASSAIINDSSTGNYALTVSQAGTAGSNSLTLNSSGAHTFTSLNVTTANSLTLNATAATTVTSLVDSANTLATLIIAGSSAATVSAITDTALTTINVTNSAAVTLASSGAALSQAGLAVNFGTSTTALTSHGSSVYLSGAGDVVTVYNTAGAVTANTNAIAAGAGQNGIAITSSAGVSVGDIMFDATTHRVIGTVAAVGANTVDLVAVTAAALGAGDVIAFNPNNTYSLTGAGSTFIGSTGSYNVTTGINGTVTLGQGVAAGVGVASANGNANSSVITVGANSTVTLGTNSAGLATDVASQIIINADSQSLVDVVTINNVKAGSTTIQMFSSGTQNTGTLVNVASAATLEQAMNLAVTVATNGGTAGNNYYAAFNWTDGNTYVIGHQGAAETALSAADVVVKIVGVDAPALTAVGNLILV